MSKVVVPAFGQTQVDVNCMNIHIVEASSAFEMSINGEPFEDFEKQLSLHQSLLEGDEPIRRIRFKNNLATELIIDYTATKGRVIDSRSNGGIINTKAGNSGSGGRETVTDTATQIVLGDSDRTRLRLQNFSDSNNIYWGFNPSVNVANGCKLDAEAVEWIETGATIYAICDTGLTADLQWAEILGA